MARKNLLQGLKRPKGISFEHLEERADYGRFVAYPFERGYGQTIGNSLRRILLSSIQGYAIGAIRIQSYKDGVAHTITSEFEMIPDVVEDTPFLIQNLKSLHLKLPEEMEEKTILVEWEGEGVLRGEHLAIDGVEVLNKDLELCTFAAGAKVDIELQINFGRGYVPAEVNAQSIDIVGSLPIDSLFSPVLKVSVSVEDYRVGHRSDYDKLILEIATNGVISPADALAEAAKIAKEHLSVFINFDEASVQDVSEVDEEEHLLRDYLDTPVEELELSVRSSNCLKNAEIRTLRDLVRKTEDDIAKTRNFGKKSLLEIKDKLKEWDLTFGMTDYSAVKARVRQGKPFGKKES